MDITAISDLHGYYPKLKGGDLLIVAGDLTADSSIEEQISFSKWLFKQRYTKKIVIAGNHDNVLVLSAPGPFAYSSYNEVTTEQTAYADYLCDSGTEFDGLKIWGSPWTKRFEGMNPKCMAFTVDTDEQLAKNWEMIPNDIDILVTHCPPFSVFDAIGPFQMQSVGSKSLLHVYHSHHRIKLHIFGHIHENGGRKMQLNSSMPIMVNASHVNEHYEPVNTPVNIIL